MTSIGPTIAAAAGGDECEPFGADGPEEHLQPVGAVFRHASTALRTFTGIALMRGIPLIGS